MGVGKSTVDTWAHLLRKERNGEETQSTPLPEERRKNSALEREVQQFEIDNCNFS